jgi:hypothetical protein
MSMMRYYTPTSEQPFDESVMVAIAMANESSECVNARISSVVVIVHPGSDPEKVREDWLEKATEVAMAMMPKFWPLSSNTLAEVHTSTRLPTRVLKEFRTLVENNPSPMLRSL